MPHRKDKEKRALLQSLSTVSTSSSGLPKWRQSPIDLCRTATWNKKFPPLYLTNYWSDQGEATITNTGRTVILEFSHRSPAYLRGGPLNRDEFQFMNVEFRWGPENCIGAEHSIRGMWYSMEAQVMHWNTRYGSIDRCFDKPDGIAILSYLMQVVGCPGISDNPSLAPITDNLPKIKQMGSSTKIAPECLHWMMNACVGKNYYTYLGSLTAPPYSECVIWIIPSAIAKISTRQTRLEISTMAGGGIYQETVENCNVYVEEGFGLPQMRLWNEEVNVFHCHDDLLN